MRSNSVRTLVALAIVSFAVIAFLALNNEGSDETGGTSAVGNKSRESTARSVPKSSKPAAPKVVVRGGEPSGGMAGLTYQAGESVEFVVVSDVADEVHIHGYDISKPVKAGGSVKFRFSADIEGIFEVELEERAVPIAELTVNP